MERKTFWRGVVLALILLFCLGTLLPTFVPAEKLPSWLARVFHRKINLGLDLQGGSHIVYGIDLDKAIDDKGSEIKRDFEAKLKEDGVISAAGVGGKVSTPAVAPGAVTVIIDDEAKRAEVKKQLQSDYGSILVERPCSATDPAGAICVRVSSDYADGIRRSALRNAVNTIRERIDEKGVAEATVLEKGDDIIVELPGLDKTRIAAVKDIIARTAKLEFKMVVDDDPWMRGLFAKVGRKTSKKTDDPTNGQATDMLALGWGISARTDNWRPDGSTTLHTDYYLQATDRTLMLPFADAQRSKCVEPKAVATTELVSCALTGRQIIQLYVDKVSEENAEYKVPEAFQLAYEKVERAGGDDISEPHWRTYYLDRAVRLSGSAITNAQVTYDPNSFQPVVQIEFNRYGGRIFGDLTAQNVGRKFATILDDKVQSAPVINGAIRGGTATITMGGGNADVKEKDAKDLVDVLKTGSLPAPLRQESISDVGPTLGRDAVDKAKLAFGLGILLVVLIMVFIYRWSGWFAVGAVAVNILIMLTMLTVLDATLTLPGIAALVLTVGTAVDGNILIYERIRDELLLGKSVRGAVDLGFSRAFSAILDAHMTGAAAGWVLLQYGSGPIKGFAVMLLLGIATTLFTNIWVGRLFFDIYVSKKKGAAATISI